MHNAIKILLALLLLLCLAEMPYGYYQLVRFVALIGFAFLAYHAHQAGNKTEAFIYGAVALLFQPFIKIALGRTIWNGIDVIVGIGLLISIFRKPKSDIN